MVTSYAIALPHVQGGTRARDRGGRQRALADPAERAHSGPRSGFPILTTEATSGLYGPASMPLDLRKRIAADVMEATRDPVVGKRLMDTGQSPNPQGPEELAKALQRQEAAAAVIAKELGIAANR